MPYQIRKVRQHPYYHHPQVGIASPGSRRVVRVDEGIAEILIALWELNIATRFSCQGSASERAYVVFGDVDSAKALRKIITRPGWEWTHETLRTSPTGASREWISVEVPHTQLADLRRAVVGAAAGKTRRAA
jgi:hypothetical protein